jgi:hypothetical protein
VVVTVGQSRVFFAKFWKKMARGGEDLGQEKR